MPAKRKRSRRRGTAARANSDLETHIASLGLNSLEEYKKWCRQQGLSGATNKSWQERRQERATAQRLQDSASTKAALDKHIKALGLASAESYRAWCSQQGLSTGLNKSERQRRKEIELAARLKSAAALNTVRRQVRRARDTIAEILDGQVAADQLKADYLRKIAEVAQALDPDARQALQKLLSVAQQRTQLLSTDPALDRLGPQPGNTFIEALAALARHWQDWLEPAADWRPDSRNLRRQFGHLARHLLSRYPVPTYMDCAWFKPQNHQQTWFKALGSGQSIRTLDLPLPLNKRMAHQFLTAPDYYTIEEALRWGQVLGQGGTPDLVEALIDTHLGTSFAHEDFWGTVIQFFVRTPQLDPAQVGPIVDYIQNQKYEPRQTHRADGQEVEDDPPQPNFSMKSRSLPKLLDQVERWHAQLAREARLPPGQWEPSAISPYHYAETDTKGRTLHWHIRELLSKKELAAEGRALNHCVVSYAHKCRSGKSSIWSVQVSDDQDNRLHLMTVELNPRSRSLSQIRGKHNVLPNARFSHQTRGGKLSSDYRYFMSQSNRHLHAWIKQEDLKRRILG